MAQVHSRGTFLNMIRKFSTSTISGAVIENSKFMYYVELVDCGIPEPFAVRVGYTT